tara:strand:+ start:1416 stop:1859 length:444 start_codon:yes stop_codon:yes gene_type:complete
LIVIAEEKHLNDIYLIEKKSFDNPWSKNHIKNDIMYLSQSENWVYSISEKVVGYIFGLIIMDEYHLTNIAVHPDYSRQKIGTKLIKHIILSLLTKNIKVILLEVSANNVPAIKYYQSMGFISVGVRKKYYKNGDDAILYNLYLEKNG